MFPNNPAPTPSAGHVRQGGTESGPSGGPCSAPAEALAWRVCHSQHTGTCAAVHGKLHGAESCPRSPAPDAAWGPCLHTGVLSCKAAVWFVSEVSVWKVPRRWKTSAEEETRRTPHSPRVSRSHSSVFCTWLKSFPLFFKINLIATF